LCSTLRCDELVWKAGGEDRPLRMRLREQGFCFKPSESSRTAGRQLSAPTSPATATVLRIRFARQRSFLKNRARDVSPLDRSLPLTIGGPSGRVLPFHYHRHPTDVSFTAVLGLDMLQHGVSGLGSLVSNASVKVLDALGVRAGTTEEDHAILVSTNAVHTVRVQLCRPMSM
jgi:hypothetical protein